MWIFRVPILCSLSMTKKSTKLFILQKLPHVVFSPLLAIYIVYYRPGKFHLDYFLAYKFSICLIFVAVGRWQTLNKVKIFHKCFFIEIFSCSFILITKHRCRKFDDENFQICGICNALQLTLKWSVMLSKVYLCMSGDWPAQNKCIITFILAKETYTAKNQKSYWHCLWHVHLLGPAWFLVCVPQTDIQCKGW